MEFLMTSVARTDGDLVVRQTALLGLVLALLLAIGLIGLIRARCGPPL
jgi:hypothetical protein